MSSAVLTERGGTAFFQGTTYPQQFTPQAPTFGGAVQQTPVGPNFLMVPRCTFKVEKCTGGVKFFCTCEDKFAATMVQNLCNMLAGGQCSCFVQFNGFTVCTFNFCFGFCKFEQTENGFTCTCTSGDQNFCQMFQNFGECCNTMLEAGCSCFFCVNNTPVCCGCSESCKTTTKKSGR